VEVFNKITVAALLLFMTTAAFPQIEKPVVWSYLVKKNNKAEVRIYASGN